MVQEDTFFKRLFAACVWIACGFAPGIADGIVLAGSEWGFASGDNRNVRFSPNGTVSGHAGCNRFSGTYKEDGGKLVLGPLAMTRMMCPPEDMERESTLVKILEDTTRFEATHLELTLFGADGAVLATLRRLDWD
jgi:heat shock protein HslJ